MAETVLRPVQPGDLPALTALWARIFGDGEELIAEFLRLLPEMGGGVAAVCGGRLAGAAYAVTALALSEPGKEPRRCGYIYAVAVAEEYRRLGLGRALTRAAADLARKQGAEILCTLPAENSLYPWYEEVLGTQCALWRTFEPIRCQSGPPVRAIGAEAYGKYREALLAGRPHLCLAPPALAFQRELCRAYGGGFFLVQNAIAAAYLDGEKAVIRELLCPEGETPEAAAAAVGAALGVLEAIVCRRAGKTDGEPYIAALPGGLPEGCVWNLSFD